VPGKLKARCGRRGRFQFGIPACTVGDTRRSLERERRALVGETGTRRVPKPRALQHVATHPGITECGKEVGIAFNANLSVARGGGPHFRRRVVPRQRGQFVDDRLRPDTPDGGFGRSGIECVGSDRLRPEFGNHARRRRRACQRKNGVTLLAQALD
jgi:hypothetical protein